MSCLAKGYVLQGPHMYTYVQMYRARAYTPDLVKGRSLSVRAAHVEHGPGCQVDYGETTVVVEVMFSVT